MPIDCGSAGVVTFRGLMKSLLHNVNRPNSRPDKGGPMLFAGDGPPILPVSVWSLCLNAIPLASGRSQEAATSLSGPSFVPDGGSSTLSGWHTLGQAVWRADQGEIVGKGTGGSGILTAPQFFTGIKPFAIPKRQAARSWCRIDSQSFRHRMRCARLRTQRRWEDGYCYFHRKWNL